MLNYKQLHHFWSVAGAGGIVRASERSGLAPKTLSGQIAALDASLGATTERLTNATREPGTGMKSQL